MRQLLLALGASLVLATLAHAQETNITQQAIPLGGADTRSLPSRTLLPPMFGANLFRVGPQTSLGLLGTAPTTAGGTQTGGGTSLQSQAAAGLAGGIGAAIAANQAGANAAGATMLGAATPGAGLTGAGAAAAGIAGAAAAGAAAGATSPGPQQPTISATMVQPPGGVPAFDPNHVMAPGDIVQIHIYGATSLDQQATVDGNGDLFLPSVGPVHVAGITAGNLEAAVSAAVASIYQKNSQVYVTLAAAVPVNVFVTGGVISPGQYALPSTSSLIVFLQAAGGVDPNRGSYRDIRVLRDRQTIATIDLYQFLLHGRLPTVRLRDRDTILVGAQGPTVAAEGDVSGVFQYELTQPQIGEELVVLARPYPDATHVNLIGVRDGRPESFYYTLDEFRRVPLRNSDVVTFNADVPTGLMTISVSGRIDGPTTLVVTREARLLDVLPYLSVDPYFVDTSAIYIRRISIAQAQLKDIHDSVQRLESTIVTSPTVTAEQATMRQQEAQIVFQFAAQLTNVQPEGRLVVQRGGEPSNVRLEDGDVIVVPSRSDLVLVNGEVEVPQSAVWIRGAPLAHYIHEAGGFTERADQSKILVIRPSGETLVGSNPPISPGDRIIVLPSPDNWTIPVIKDITQIIYQIAVGAGVFLNLR
jgi:protein involved in polysaccharide export with SLBB domain